MLPILPPFLKVNLEPEKSTLIFFTKPSRFKKNALFVNEDYNKHLNVFSLQVIDIFIICRDPDREMLKKENAATVSHETIK